MLNQTVLKNMLKPGFITLFNQGYDGDVGMHTEDFAEQLAKIIADAVISHITANAQVTTTVTGIDTLTQAPIQGAGTGVIA